MQAIKDTLWGFANLNYRPTEAFLDAAAMHCTQKLDEFNPQNIANVAWAYAKIGYTPGDLLNTFASQVCSPSTSKCKSFDPSPFSSPSYMKVQLLCN